MSGIFSKQSWCIIIIFKHLTVCNKFSIAVYLKETYLGGSNPVSTAIAKQSYRKEILLGLCWLCINLTIHWTHCSWDSCKIKNYIHSTTSQFVKHHKKINIDKKFPEPIAISVQELTIESFGLYHSYFDKTFKLK